MSFIRSYQQLAVGAAEIIFLNDGPIPEDRLRMMERWGEVVARPNLGLRQSWQTALAIPVQRAWRDDDLVWLAEDDYLYLPNALPDLIAAAEAYPNASYFGLYAMIGSRLPNGGLSLDRVPPEDQWPQDQIKLVNEHPWRSALSTTSTFGARVRPLVEDRSMMQFASRSGGAWDHTISLMYQGFTPYPAFSLLHSLLALEAPKHWPRRAAIFTAHMCLDFYQVARSIGQSNPRLLVAADPALITHLETAYLAAGTDWRSVATSTQHAFEPPSDEPTIKAILAAAAQ